MAAQIIRIGLRRHQFTDPLLDLAAPEPGEEEGVQPPTFTRGTAVSFQIGCLNAAGTDTQTLASFESITLRLLEPGTGVLRWMGTKLIDDVEQDLDFTDWEDGVDETATWELTSADTNIPTTAVARPLLLVCDAMTNPDGDGHRNRVMLGCGYVQMLGVDGPDDGLPTEALYPFVRIGELTGIVNSALSDLNAVRHISGSAPTAAADSRGAVHSLFVGDDGFLYVKSASGWGRTPFTLLP